MSELIPQQARYGRERIGGERGEGRRDEGLFKQKRESRGGGDEWRLQTKERI